MVALIACNALLLGISLTDTLQFEVFAVLMALTILFIGSAWPNLRPLTLQPLGNVAGTASSFLGCVSMISVVILSGIIAQLCSGTTDLLHVFFVVFGLLGVVGMFIAKGRAVWSAGALEEQTQAT